MITKRFVFSDDSIKDPDFDSNACSSDTDSEEETSIDVSVKACLPATSNLPSHGEVEADHEEQQSDPEFTTQNEIAMSDSADSANSNTWTLPKGNQPNLIPFTKDVGVSLEFAAMMQGSNPEDFYFSLVDDEFFTYVADQTNMYATQTICKSADTSKQSRLHEWNPTDKYEIKRFFGLICYMGIVKMPNISCYWSKEKMFKVALPAECMSRNRFELLIRMVHFSNNEENTLDRLHKVQPVVDKIQKNIQSVYNPSEVVCVDESLIPFRGRLVMRQYIKNKRHRYGIKLFKLCSYGGFTYSMQIYAGKNLELEKTTPTRVVLNLCQPILNCGRTLITDNWYTSVELACKLLENQTHLVGTLRKNRKNLPTDVTNKKLKSGEHVIRENGQGISVIKWRDKRDVLLLSTKHSDAIVPTTNRLGNIRHKPQIVVAYNQGKSAVDLSDQLTAYQSPLRKTVKWYRKLAIEIILNTAMVNAWVMYREVSKENIKLLEFRKKVTYKLCESRPTEILLEPTQKEKRKRHEIGTKPYNKRRPCMKCYEKVKSESGWKIARNIKRIRTYCQSCPDEPSLCLECFNAVHRA